MLNLLKKSNTWALGIVSVIFTVIPETIFKEYKLLTNYSDKVNIVLDHVLIFIIVLVLLVIVNAFYLKFRRNVYIRGHNYSINIKYGNLFKMHECKKVIPFDECFTTNLGNYPGDVNSDSICGQYLKENPNLDIKALINNVKLIPQKNKSKYQSKECYISGKLIPNCDYLLLSFAKLDKDGLGRLTREEYLDCLSVLWEEIDKYYGQKDVCIPILGSGVTRISGTSLTQQELLDIIVYSYKLSTYKIKSPNKLYIVCKKKDNFSLNKICENL